ncbi:MAG: FAD-dependent oxidoreductase, partial [Oscillospiraceae bacterium]|nr:FAD-dependent oxidoreductase [Oscillospiraceae bacterium]
MRRFDAAVIGGGVLGCFAARNLRRWNIDTALIEMAEDVCTGITRANSAIVYPGYDNRPGSLKAQMTVVGNRSYGELCDELEVPFSRCGSLLVTYDPASVPRLERKLRHGAQNGVPGLRMLSGREAEELEPMLSPGVAAALYAPTTGTVNPWQLGIAAYENAVENGAAAMLNTQVTDIREGEGGYIIETSGETVFCKAVLNCGGLYADRVQSLIYPSPVSLRLDGADYLVLDPLAEKPARVIFHQAKSCGKGITAIPCVEGNLLISGVRRPLGSPFATTSEGLRELHGAARELLPSVELDKVIRSFGAVRPNPQMDTGESLHDFCIENPAPGFYSLIGIKTPGLTCANQLGMYLAGKTADYLGAESNPTFHPSRRAIAKGDGEVICQCEQVTRGEISQAIRRGA